MQQVKRALAPLGLSVDDTVTVCIHHAWPHGARQVTNTVLMLKRSSPTTRTPKLTHDAQVYSDSFAMDLGH